jgi:RHS repeat-associated protein
MARWSRTGLRAARGVALAGTGLFLLLPGSPSRAGEVVEYYHLDAIGNVRAVTNAAGQVVERHDYLPFGEECTTGSCASNPGLNAGQPRKFTGKERDAETGLDYFGARYYGSKIGRFTTTDPVYTWRENLVDPQRWNRYAYARNNPLRYTDPDGKEIALAANLSKGDAKFIVSALTQIAGRPSGREALTTLINDPSRIVFGVGSVNDPANVDAARKGETVGLTFGTTTFLDPTTNEVAVTIDRQALGEFASRTRPSLDSQGVTTTAHEIYHARDALSGKPQQFVAGDRPTSATGPAEGFGQSVRREKRDIPRDAARQIVTGALEKKQ